MRTEHAEYSRPEPNISLNDDVRSMVEARGGLTCNEGSKSEQEGGNQLLFRQLRTTEMHQSSSFRSNKHRRAHTYFQKPYTVRRTSRLEVLKDILREGRGDAIERVPRVELAVMRTTWAPWSSARPLRAR